MLSYLRVSKQLSEVQECPWTHHTLYIRKELIIWLKTRPGGFCSADSFDIPPPRDSQDTHMTESPSSATDCGKTRQVISLIRILEEIKGIPQGPEQEACLALHQRGNLWCAEEKKTYLFRETLYTVKDRTASLLSEWIQMAAVIDIRLLVALLLLYSMKPWNLMITLKTAQSLLFDVFCLLFLFVFIKNKVLQNNSKDHNYYSVLSSLWGSAFWLPSGDFNVIWMQAFLSSDDHITCCHCSSCHWGGKAPSTVRLTNWLLSVGFI